MQCSEEYLRDEIDGKSEFPIQDEPDITALNPYEYIYAPYEREEKYHQLYERAPGLNHPFRSVDRIKLVLIILESDEDWGCGLELYNLKNLGSILAYYPMREFDVVKNLERDWLPWHVSLLLLINFSVELN